MHDNHITIFENPEFGRVRTCTEQNGDVLFCATDVAKALGYARPADAITAHCRGSVNYRPIIDQLGRAQEAKFIAEPDVMRLIVSSKLPAAQKFEAWVFEEVLPSVRKHGIYATAETAERLMSDPDFMIKTFEALKKERARARAAANLNRRYEKDIERQGKQIDEMHPKALFADAVAASDSTILIGDLAKILKQNGVDTGQKRLFEWLRENGWLMKHGASRNMPTQKAMDMGLFRVKETTINNPDGSVHITKTTKVTGKGQRFFVSAFLEGRVA